MLQSMYATDFIAYSWLPVYKNLSLLHQKYVQENQSPAQIAKEFGCSRTAVQENITKAGIPRNQRAEIVNLNRRRVAKTIIEYRRLGMTFQQIADILNKVGIPPERSKEWYCEKVAFIYKRYSKKKSK